MSHPDLNLRIPDSSRSSMSELHKDSLADESSNLEKQQPLSTDPGRANSTHDISKDEPTDAQSLVTDWNGPEDPENPQNWRLAVKVYHVTVPGLFGFAV